MYRSFPGSLVLLGILVFLIVIPLQWMKPGHPLAGEDTFDLCAILRDGALQQLPRPALDVKAEIPGFQYRQQKQPSCYILLWEDDAGKPSRISTLVTTQRFLSLTGRRQKTDVYIDTSLKEAAAGGYSVTPLEGPWRRAAVLYRPDTPDSRQILVDDDGVALWFNAVNIEPDALRNFAATSALRLKDKK